VLASQGFALHLDVFPRMLDARRHCCNRELHTRHARSGQQILVCGPQLRYLVLQ
jgi:hypothetical protein